MESRTDRERHTRETAERQPGSPPTVSESM